MKTFVWAAVCGALVSGALPAAPLYQIRFTGTITSGTAKDFNLTDNLLETVADLTGLPVSGSMTFDLGTAPVPVVSVDASGFTNTRIQSSGGPIFVSEHFVIGPGIPLGPDFLSLPAAFDLAPVPAVPSGTTVTQVQDDQALVFSSKPVLGPQAVTSDMNLSYFWSGPQTSGTDLIALDLLIASALEGPHFFPVPPTGQIPSAWGPVNPGGNGVFTLALLTQNPLITDHFGIVSDYSVTGGFTFDSVSGGFVATPEPGTFALAATVLALAAAAFFQSRRDGGSPLRRGPKVV